MKRLIAMLVLFFLMLGFSVFEILYIQKFYSAQLELLNEVEVAYDIDSENIDRQECIKAVTDLLRHWNKNKKAMMMMGNHNVTKYIDEKLVALKQLTQMNQTYDAYVTLKSLQVYAKNQKDDVLPLPGNLL